MLVMPTRRSAKNAKVARADGLSRDVILCAALDLAKRTGLDGFSMRDLAAELGVTQMAAYHYVKSREELLTLLVDEILRGVRFPGPEDGTWDERVRIFVESCLDVLTPWRDSGSVLMRVRPPRAFDVVVSLVQVLREAGFTDRDAILGARMVRVWAWGELSVRQQGEHRLLANITPRAEEMLDTARREGIGESDIAAFTIDVMIDGLRARLQPRERDSSESV